MLETNKSDSLRMKLNNNLFLYKLDDSLAWLLDVDSGEYHDLNDSSYFVLSLFDGKKTIEKIQNIFLAHYSKSGIEKSILKKDFHELLKQFFDENILMSLQDK